MTERTHGRATDDAFDDASADEIRRAERRRIAQDLHDGLAQDLALIAAYADRLGGELGSEHPVAVAARRALSVARGTMIDLAASSEPTTLDALRAVAAEVESRHPVLITVSGAGAGDSLDSCDRHEVVRIAREAMVNAARHGSARRISVVFGASTADDMILRVVDDGVGIGGRRPASEGSGMGLPDMRRRARSLGGRLVTRRANTGGTEVGVRV